jgi:long-chain acyl-CoA synthetase
MPDAAEGSTEGGRRRAGAPIDFEPGTLVDLYLDAVDAHRSHEARKVRNPDGTWTSYGYDDVDVAVREVALGLLALGLERGDRIGLVSDTRMEWALADFGLVMAGGLSVPVYPSLPPGQVQYILEDADARAAFVEDQEQYDKLVEVRDELPKLETVVAFEAVQEHDELPVFGLDDLRRRGREADEPEGGYVAHARRADPDDVATLIYTSGTTGRPKGVMLTHHNFYSNSLLSARVLPVGPEDTALSWLPLSHVFERMAGHYLMWARGVTVAYAESVETLARDLVEVAPTIMTAVPRVYEKFYEGAATKAREKGGLAPRIFEWATSVGEARADRILAGQRPGPWLSLRYRLADRLVFSKIRERAGGRIRYFISGGGPLEPAVGKFLWAADLPVLEGYGLTETSPVLAVNPPGDVRLGTVGPPIDGTELRIADDGEILARGPQIMKGYYRNEEATREVLDEDGWLRTGDVGELDADGYLKITGRKKEILVNSYGKNIAPAPVENAIKRSRFVEHALLVGDRKKFTIVVVQPMFENLADWAAKQGLGDLSPDELIRDEAVQEHMAGEVFPNTREFADHERPEELLLVPDVFDVDTGELTPTMKVKRRVLLEAYGDDIERLYEKAGEEGAEGRRDRSVAAASSARSAAT